MDKSFLPIGSIITVDNIDLMICSYIKKGKLVNNIQYNYACCRYPIGLDEKAILVQAKDITGVKFIGYQDNRYVELKRDYGDNA